jgi:flavodoxin
VLVTYFSLTGNTEKIARVIYEEVSKKHKVDIKKIDEIKADALNNYDLIFVGSPCHAGDLAGSVKNFLNNLPNSPKYKLAGFFTHFSPIWSKEDYDKARISFETLSKQKQINYLGTFHCRGAPTFSPEIAEMVKKAKKLSQEEYNSLTEEAKKHPSPEDEERAREFAQIIITKK